MEFPQINHGFNYSYKAWDAKRTIMGYDNIRVRMVVDPQWLENSLENHKGQVSWIHKPTAHDTAAPLGSPGPASAFFHVVIKNHQGSVFFCSNTISINGFYHAQLYIYIYIKSWEYAKPSSNVSMCIIFAIQQSNGPSIVKFWSCFTAGTQWLQWLPFRTAGIDSILSCTLFFDKTIRRRSKS